MAAEHWTEKKWRPMMAWMYMVVCVLDFAIFPVLWSILQAKYQGQVTNQWDPLTLKGAGLFHMAMGAVLGVTAWSRGQEKMAGANNGGITQSTSLGVSSSGSSNFQAPTSANSINPAGTSGSINTSSVGSVSAATASGKAIVPVGNEPVL